MVVPLIAGLLEQGTDQEDRARAHQVVSALLGWMLLITVPIAIVIASGAEPLARLILGSGTGEATDATVVLGASMLRVFSLQLPLYGVTVVLAAYLQAAKRFLWPALVPLISSLVLILVYRLYAAVVPAVATTETVSSLAEGVLAWGTTAGVLAMAVCLVVPCRRAGLRVRPTLRMPPGYGRRALSLAGAGLGAVGAQQLALGLVLLLAMSAGGTGTLPVFQYAQAVYLLPYAVLVVPVVTAVFPHLSAQRLIGDAQAYARTASGSLRMIVVLATVGAATLFAAGPALEAFFHQIDRAGATGVGATVAALSLGLVPYAITTQCTRILSASLRARDALVVGAVGWLVGGALIVLAATALVTGNAANAATGFAFALSAGMWVSALVGLGRVSDILETAGSGPVLWRNTFVGGVAALAAGIPGLVLGRAMLDLSQGPLICMLVGILTGLTGMVLAGVVMGLLDRDASRRLLRAVRARTRRRDRRA
jgi:putative peptidoglycan lipid II flippase